MQGRESLKVLILESEDSCDVFCQGQDSKSHTLFQFCHPDLVATKINESQYHAVCLTNPMPGLEVAQILVAISKARPDETKIILINGREGEKVQLSDEITKYVDFEYNGKSNYSSIARCLHSLLRSK